MSSVKPGAMHTNSDPSSPTDHEANGHESRNSSLSRTRDDHRSPATDKNWQIAQERILLYLRMLGVPPVQTVAIALEALESAASEDRHGSNAPASPVTQAMQAMWQIRGARLLFALEEANEQKPSPETISQGGGPPIKRRSMVPEPMDRAPWLSFLGRMFSKIMSKLWRLSGGAGPGAVFASTMFTLVNDLY